MLRHKYVFQLYLVELTVKCNLALSRKRVASETSFLKFQMQPEMFPPPAFTGSTQAHTQTSADQLKARSIPVAANRTLSATLECLGAAADGKV